MHTALVKIANYVKNANNIATCIKRIHNPEKMKKIWTTSSSWQHNIFFRLFFFAVLAYILVSDIPHGVPFNLLLCVCVCWFNDTVRKHLQNLFYLIVMRHQLFVLYFYNFFFFFSKRGLMQRNQFPEKENCNGKTENVHETNIDK